MGKRADSKFHLGQLNNNEDHLLPEATITTYRGQNSQDDWNAGPKKIELPKAEPKFGIDTSA